MNKYENEIFVIARQHILQQEQEEISKYHNVHPRQQPPTDGKPS